MSIPPLLGRPGGFYLQAIETVVLTFSFALLGSPRMVLAEDLFVVTADLTYTGTDAYRYEHKYEDGFLDDEIDAHDAFAYHYVGRQTIRTTKPNWTETYESQYTVSGGGGRKAVHYDKSGPPTTTEYSWTYSFDPTKALVSDADFTNLGYKFATALVMPFPSWPVAVQGPVGGYGQISAMGIKILTFGLHAGEIPLPTNTTTYVVTRNYSTNVVSPYTGTGETGQQSGTYRAVVTIQRNPAPLEAVILPDPPPLSTLPTYVEWLPSAGRDEETPGTNILVRVILRPKGSSDREPVSYGRAKFTFQLNDVSQEPGVCMNSPSKDKLNPAAGPDLRIAASSLLTISNNGLGAETTQGDLSQATVVINAFDYGAYGKLSVYADIPGQGLVKALVIDHPDQDFLRLPQDENDNHIADTWEKENGTWGAIVDPKWDQADDPDEQDADGDGISLYEKYRGFVFANAHERLEPHRKYLFVYDPDGLVQQDLQSSQSFQAGSYLRVRFVRSGTWTGPGQAGSQKRIVNFNTSGFGHATDQHAEHVRMITTKSPLTPSDYINVYRAKYGTNTTEKVDGAFGITYPDFSVDAPKWSPQQWLVIECYIWNVDNYARAVVKYHTYALPQFAGYAAATPSVRAAMDIQVAKEVSDYIQANQDDWERLNWMVLMMTTSHEMGHGVAINDLQEPRNRGPMNCFMRYLGYDFPRNPADRFEMAARWQKAGNIPQIFCKDATATVPGKGCFEQIHVTDRHPSAAALNRLPSLQRVRATGTGSNTRRLLDLQQNPWLSIFNEPTPPLRLATDLEWESVLAGDPLRVSVRLSMAMVSEAWELSYLSGDTNPPPALLPISADWLSGLRMELVRVETNGTRTTVLAPADWAAHLRATVADPALFESRLATRQREFLVSPAAAKLQPGQYAINASWEGTGLIDASLLTNNATFSAPEIQFTVGELSTDIQRAVQLRRLAYQAWDAGDNDAARQLGVEALRLDPTNVSREALEAHLVVASAALRQGDWFGSASALDSLRGTIPAGGQFSEVSESVMHLLSALVPELHLKQPGSDTSPTLLDVVGHVGQIYRLEASDDLRTWETLQTLTTQSNQFEVTAPPNAGARKYFRVIWLKP